MTHLKKKKSREKMLHKHKIKNFLKNKLLIAARYKKINPSKYLTSENIYLFYF